MRRFLSSAIVIAVIASTAFAGGPPAMFAIVDKIELKPDAKTPQTIRIWGSFTRAKPRTMDYQQPVYGYMLLRIDAKAKQECRSEWVEWQKAADSGNVMAVGICLDAGRFVEFPIRKANEKVTTPDGVYPVRKICDYPVGYFDKDEPVKRLRAFEARRKTRSNEKALQGTWHIVSYVDDGRELLAGKKGIATITKSRLTLRHPPAKVVCELDYRLVDTPRRPRHIQLAEIQQGRAGKEVPGIYHLKGKTLSICFCESSIETVRPTKFRSTADNSCILIVLKRAESDKRDKQEVSYALPGTGSKDRLDALGREKPRLTNADLKRAQGIWSVVRYKEESTGVGKQDGTGRELMQAVISDRKVVFQYRPDDPRNKKSEYLIKRIDSTATPKEIDAVFLKDGKESIQRGIYMLGTDVITCEFAKPGQPRPRQFRASGNESTQFLILRRPKPKDD